MLSIPYNGKTSMLQGELTSLPPGTVVQVTAITTTKPEPSTPIPAIAQLLQEYQSVFAPPQGYPPERAFAHEIPLVPGALPVNVRPYRYPPAVKDEIERQISDMLSTGIVQPSQSPFSSSVLLVKKKDGTYRFCVDFRHLNTITIKAKYPVPVIEELLDELHGASWFTSLDLTAGYHQIRLKPGDEPKTAFQTHTGQYEFRVMAFGLTGAPATFLKAMNITLGPLLRKCVLVFFDDILVYSRTLEEHVDHVRLVLQLLHRDQWQVKLAKCVFAQRQLRYLGHLISEQGVATDPEKVQAVLQWPPPASVKDLRSFLGLAGYYRRFVRHFGMISRPLTDLLKKGAVFVWTEVQEQAFSTLKQALTSAPVLAMPNFSKPFVIETDASGTGIGAVLMQQGHPLAFLSKTLSPRLQGLSTYEKEYLAILLAVEHWRSYLQLAEFQILTDHKSLIQLEEQRLHTPWQQKVFTRLLGLQYRIVYKKGVDNGAADALSRAPVAQCTAISVSQPQWLEEVLQSYVGDQATQDLLAKMADASVPTPHYTLKDGLIRYKGRIWIGNDATLRLKLLQAMHSSAVGGHSGVPVTYRRVKQHFYWVGLKSAVHSFVSACQICQQAKPDRTKLPGLLQPLPVPERAWKVLSLDFVEGLPVSEGHNCILVVVDLFTKYAHFLSLRHPFTAATVAKVFLSQVYRLHGMPSALVSDRDKVFTSALWRELFKLAKVELHMSTAYHPQSDGRPSVSINVCKRSCAVLCMLVLGSGISGWTWRSFGTTRVGTQLWVVLHLRSSMAMLHHTLALLQLMSSQSPISPVGCRTVS
jgi:transposase InsO family protein